MELDGHGFFCVTWRPDRRTKFGKFWARLSIVVSRQDIFICIVMKLHFDRHPRPQSLSPQHVQFFKNSRQLHQMRIATGKKFKEPQTDTAFSRVWNMIQQSRSPVFHAIGNHELYNFKPSQLRDQFNEEGGAQVETTLHSYHVRTNTTSYLHNSRKKKP